MLNPQHMHTNTLTHLQFHILYVITSQTSLQCKYTLHRYTKNTHIYTLKLVSLAITVDFPLYPIQQRHKRTQAPPVSMSSTDL